MNVETFDDCQDGSKTDQLAFVQPNLKVPGTKNNNTCHSAAKQGEKE
jgi:hypothetical protein